MRRSSEAFTLAELLVSLGVLTLLVLIAGRMINSAATVATFGSKRMDADSQVRPVLNRIAVDFSQMVRRADVDYYVKSSLNPEPGNDQIAFFANVAGYYPTPSFQSPVSLVAYRINSDATSAASNRMQRMGKGLVWNSVSSTYKPILFLPETISTNWPGATVTDPTDPNYQDADYELIGPQIFRFEYFYQLKSGAISDLPGAAGMKDVAAIVATVACIDPKSRVPLTDCQIGGQSSSPCGSYTDNGLIQRMVDFNPATHPKVSDLTASWQTALDGIVDMPRIAINGVRIYQRYFYLDAAK